jgi:hypothetical protein
MAETRVMQAKVFRRYIAFIDLERVGKEIFKPWHQGQLRNSRTLRRGEPCALANLGDLRRVAIGLKLTDISWDSVQNVNIFERDLQIVTEEGAYRFPYANVDELSEALLILALQGTKQVEFLDDRRFNPARLL